MKMENLFQRGRIQKFFSWITENGLLVLVFTAILFAIFLEEFSLAALFSVATTFIAYLAYAFSKEKFRLELFEERYAIYEKIVEVCSRMQGQGAANEGAWKAADECLRGLGWHKVRMFFGEEVHNFTDELHKKLIWLSTSRNAPENEEKRHIWADEWSENMEFVQQATKRLPEIFSSYMYFGDYRKNAKSPLNRWKLLKL